MQSNSGIQTDASVSPFQGLLVEEFLLEPNLRQEFNIPDKASELALRFSKKAASILQALIVSKIGIPIPQDVIQEVVDSLFAQRHTSLIFRSIADILATVRSTQDKYNSCCRSAICHASMGSYDFAFGALRNAASVNDYWARHHHIYGLIHGIKNSKAQALYELQIAYAYEPFSETKARIAYAIELLKS